MARAAGQGRRVGVRAVGLAVGLALVGWLAWPAGDTRYLHDTFSRVAAEVEARRPDDREVDEARARARLAAAAARLAARHEGPRRPLQVEVVACGRIPAAGARVTALDPTGGVVARGVTAEDGRVTVQVPVGVAITPTAEADDGAGASLPTEADAAEVVVCAGATLEGLVVDEAGRPVAEAEVRLEGADSDANAPEELDLATSDGEGRFVLTDQLLLGRRVVASAAAGRGQVEVADLSPDETREVRVTLAAGRVVRGMVVSPEGQPVPAADVTAADGRGVVVARARTDRFGRFWLKRTPLVPVELMAANAEGVSASVVAGPDEDEEVVLTLEAAALVAISASSDDYHFVVVDVGTPEERRIASADGPRAELRLGAPGRVAVRAIGPEGETVCGELLLAPGGHYQVACTGDDRPAVAVGRVVDEHGQPLAGAQIGLQRRGGREGGGRGASPGPVAVSDATGRFRLEVDQVGRATLVAWVADRSLLPASRRNVPLARGQVADVGDIVLQTRETVSALFQERPFGGIGASIAPDGAGIRFQRLVAGGPLDRAGIREGDVLLAIAGQRVETWSVRETAQRLRGPAGSQVELQVWRNGREERLVVERETIDIHANGWR